jgi:hypothetical protein
MSEFEEGSPPDWFQDISNAFASSRQTPPERRLQTFLATLSSETLRLAASESPEETGEVLAYATACIHALFNDPSAAVSDNHLDRLTPRVHVMLILESLQRRGYVRVDYGDALDPMALGACKQLPAFQTIPSDRKNRSEQAASLGSGYFERTRVG